jgi:hypothetical protein
LIRSAGGRTLRRNRREWQWWRCPDRFAEPSTHTADAADFEFVAAEHSSPLFRPLAGVEERLQRNKVVNLGLAVARLDGVVVRPGSGSRFGAWSARRRAGAGSCPAWSLCTAASAKVSAAGCAS